jgi:2-polyprenyl-3-methyl-5-hydroxy-6-metoxy-1,4-benzoquinol methylase
VIATADLRREDRILEVGAGMGRFSIPLKRLGYDILASDLSPELLGRLRAVDPAVRTLEADVLGLDEKTTGRFDKIIGFFMLHHLSDLPGAMRQFARVLRPGGTVTFCEPNAFYPPYYAQVLLTPGMTWAAEKGLRAMRPGVLRPILAEAGFSRICFRGYGYFPPRLTNTRSGAALERMIEMIPLPQAAKAFLIIHAARPCP